MPLSTVSPALSPRLASAVAASSTAAIAVLDYFTPANLMAPMLYVVPLAFAAIARDRRFLIGLSAFVTALTFVVYLIGQPAVPGTDTVALANRLLAGVVVLAAAIALVSWVNAERVVEKQRSALEEQNRELEAINEELGQREAEIVRQNEELQAQTEELERQSEELRVTNDELATREKTLEQLLELSRSLTAELERGAMMEKICEALGLLTQGLASAIVEKKGDQVHLPCYHGFGPDGLASSTLPFAGSFSAVVMSMGQSAYVEDTRLRPDLHFPTPRDGEPPRAVLATPLRVHGRVIGTLELYARERQGWSEALVAMLESLAAEASISLQSVDLVEVIRQERRRFEAAFHTVPFGLAVADDPAAAEVRLNPAAAALFGVPAGDCFSPRSPVWARLRRCLFGPAGPLPESRWPLLRALTGEEVHGEEMDLVLPNGQRHHLLTSAAPVYDKDGVVTGAVWAFADITPQKRLQRELDLRRREAEEASVRKTRFLASVSHDIRTPVNAITLMAEVIRRSADNPAAADQIPHLAQRLKANALALVELVTDVLDLARVDTGKVELLESEFALHNLLAEECKQLQPLAADKRLTLELEPPDRPLWARTDRVKVARVVGNLIGNAIKFTDAGTVRVNAVLGPERQVVIRVADTGLGIAPEHLAYIFDEFAQLRNPARDAEKGTGLGLAICKRLVEAMGGTIAVESTPERGSTFTVTLPATCVVLRLDGPANEPPPEPAANGRVLKGLRVLLVEDHAPTRDSTVHILRDEGAEVAEATDGGSALAAIDRGNADVLLLDMMLPDLDGREVLRRLQSGRPNGLRAVIVMTGDLTTERLDEVRRLGADALISKPIDVGKLIGVLQGLPKT